MIAYGICIASQEKFERCALKGIRAFADADSPIAESTENASIFTAYNEMLDAFATEEALEALVLLHEDLEIRDPDFTGKLRRRIAEPDVAVVGVVGARGVPNLCWWDGETFGRCAETRGLVDFGGGTHDVDVVDGLLMALSPWAVRNLRFDDGRFSGFHAYDLDFCLQARAAAKRVVVDDIDVFHHTKGGYGDVETFARANAAFLDKWSGAELLGH